MKLLTSILTFVIFLINISFAQQISRDNVLLEIGTGTWCVYCPGSAMGADDLVANGHDVVVIENHNGDSYTNTASNARNSYYNISGYPTALFDGGSAYVGGSNSTSLYPQYLSRYNQKINVPTSFSIDIQGTSQGSVDFNVDVTIEMVDPYVGSDIRLHCAITESHIAELWQGQTHLNFVNRPMLPNHNGIPLDFSSGDVIQQNYSFLIDPEWLPENCEFVIFVQEYGTKEVFNASKKDLLEFANINDYDASLWEVSNIPEESCSGTFAPSVLLRNNGNIDLNTLTFHYKANDGELETYDWTGNLPFLGEELVDLPIIYFTPSDDNTLEIYCEGPNGQTDQYLLNDTIYREIPNADAISSNTVTLFLRCDSNPEETTWELQDSDGNVLHEGGPYTTPGYTFTEEFELDDLSCYQFYLNDSGGDGLSSPGFFALFYGSSNYILQGMGDFGLGMGTNFSTDDVTSIDDKELGVNMNVYPNPFSHHTNISIKTNETSHVQVSLYNILQELVYQSDEGILSSGEQLIKINRKDLENGIYFVQLQVNDKMYIKKVTIVN